MQEIGESSKEGDLPNEGDKKQDPTKADAKPKRKAQVEPSNKEDQAQSIDISTMEIDKSKEDLSTKEVVLKRLMKKW